MKLSLFSSIDWLIMIAIGILLIVSLVTLFSIDPAIFKTQFIFLFPCLAALFFFSQFNLSVLKYYAIPIYITSIVVLGAVLLLGIESRGSTRWVEILGVRVQFSEIFKPFLALSLASFLANLRTYSLKSFISAVVLLAPISFLIFMQPDLGSALIYVFVTMGALLIIGFPFKWFLAGFIVWLASLPFFWMILHEYQRQRLLTFINPSSDPLGTSYNAIQAVIAVGSGMFFGRGLGQGTQTGLKFLPEHHTDFIFAALSEQLGFIGSAIIIIAFSFILYRIFIIVVNSEDKFSKAFSLIVFLILFVQFFINVGMNIGIVPIVGVTLPFVSYGGSSLLSSFILLGLLFAVNKKSRREVLEIR